MGIITSSEISVPSSSGVAIAPTNMVTSRTTDVPESPAIGARYIVPVGATGIWVGLDNQIATWSGVWSYQTPLESWLAYVDDEDLYYVYTGSAWVVSGVTAHAASHEDGGTDEITIENLPTSGAVGTVPTSQGDGTLAMATPAGGGGAVLASGSASITMGEGSPPDPDSTWNTNGFNLIFEASNMEIKISGSSQVIASSIDAESEISIDSDPSSIITSAAFITVSGSRQVQITASGNTGSAATVSWTWNSRTFTLTVVATAGE